jgi:hypothetical protein
MSDGSTASVIGCPVVPSQASTSAATAVISAITASLVKQAALDAPITSSIGCPAMVEAELGRFGDKRPAGVANARLASLRSERTLCLPQLAKDRNQFAVRQCSIADMILS